VGGFGGNKPATIWHDAMAPILEGQPAVPFPPADPAVVAGTRDSGAAPAPADRTTSAPAPTDSQPPTETPPADGGNGGRGNGGND
jgi:membrane peptidoglycan carboxypeptidase